MEVDDFGQLSPRAQRVVLEWKTKWRAQVDRPTWDEYYLNLAFEVSKRSIDSQTQHGCVITNRQHQPLGFGYNSFVRGIDDTVLPNIRPAKYPFMIHSELNAIFNCTSRPTNGIAYITGPPCPHCLQSLWQAGVMEIVFGNQSSKMQENHEGKAHEEILVYLLRDRGLVYRGVDYVRDKTV